MRGQWVPFYGHLAKNEVVSRRFSSLSFLKYVECALCENIAPELTMFACLRLSMEGKDIDKLLAFALLCW
jgi:hypothetical protein